MVPVYRKFVQQHYRLSAYLLTNGANAVDSKCFFVALLASLCFFCCICYFPFVSSVFFLSTFVLMFIFITANRSAIHPLDYRTMSDIAEFSLQQQQQQEKVNIYLVWYFPFFLFRSTVSLDENSFTTCANCVDGFLFSSLLSFSILAF